ncbi:MAG: FtsX-like permease family protein [Planctomycetaceae bacterium]|nr:FtsX-like permease family protein [Planctomycetaceae bacterium]
MYDIILPLKLFKSNKLTILAVLAVAVSVFTVIVVMTVMNGLTVDFINQNHRFYSDCIISTDSLVGFADYNEFATLLRSQDYVESATPVINSFGLVLLENTGRSGPMTLMGIDVDHHFKTTGFADSLYYRKDKLPLAFVPTYNDELPGCIVGIDLIENRDEWGNYQLWPATPRRTFNITCFPLSPKGTLVKTGTSISANTKTYHQSDNSNTGLAKVDGTTVYLPFDELQTLNGMDMQIKRTSAIFIKFKHGHNTEKSVEKTAALWKSFTGFATDPTAINLSKNVNVQDFKSYKRETIAPMEKERAMMLMLFLMVGLITVFIIFVIFYMIIGRKNKDIGILKSIGASRFGITLVFLRYAVLIGIVGSAIGTAAGLVFLDYVNDLEGWLFYKFGFQLWNREIYAIGDIPNHTGVALPVAVAAAAIIACLLGAALPTIKAARQNCVDILRVNNI